ncbi:ribonuclease HII [Pseudahrensia aquimaris]|uniref:Ribonuclease HII n=1 Tax=Pseudahrensia aquimaris TaxID=744461 RepID=A0ABW3FCU9_9HYPH
MRTLPADSPQLFSPTGGAGPTFDHEQIWADQGLIVCGCDEAGRGPLAGSVTAAAVVLDVTNIPDGLDDSKKLSEKRREALFHEIMVHHAVAAICLNAATIDAMNIRAASLKAMEMAVAALPLMVEHSLIDGNAVPDGLKGRATALVKGDSRSLSIAAASIVAKVLRDRQMVHADSLFPQYGFAGHKGYPSAAHRELVAQIGPCPLHRKTFAPVRKALEARRGNKKPD